MFNHETYSVQLLDDIIRIFDSKSRKLSTGITLVVYDGSQTVKECGKPSHECQQVSISIRMLCQLCQWTAVRTWQRDGCAFFAPRKIDNQMTAQFKGVSRRMWIALLVRNIVEDSRYCSECDVPRAFSPGLESERRGVAFQNAAIANKIAVVRDRYFEEGLWKSRKMHVR